MESHSAYRQISFVQKIIDRLHLHALHDPLLPHMTQPCCSQLSDHRLPPILTRIQNRISMTSRSILYIMRILKLFSALIFSVTFCMLSQSALFIAKTSMGFILYYDTEQIYPEIETSCPLLGALGHRCRQPGTLSTSISAHYYIE